MESITPRRAWHVLIVLALVVFALHAFYSIPVLTYRPFLQVQYVPDDGYYYIDVARHHGDTGVWTMDSGTSVTSGFHMLHAKLLSKLRRLTSHSSMDFARIAVVYSVVLGLITLAVILLLAGRSGIFPLAAAIVVLAHDGVARMIPAAMEWPYAVLFSGLYFFIAYRSARRWSSIFALAVIGYFGSLARTEFGLIPFAILITAIIARDFKKLLPFAGGLIGATLGLATVLLRNWLTVGTWIQDSAVMKSHWGKVGGYSAKPAFRISMSIFVPPQLNHSVAMFMLTLAALAMIVILIAIVFRRPLLEAFGKLRASPTDATTFLAAIIIIAGYLFLYGFNNQAVQTWYNAMFIIPMTVVLAYFFAGLAHALPRRHDLAIIIVAAIYVLANGVYILATPPPFRGQEHLYLAGKILQLKFPNDRVGGWNSGVSNYYQGGTLINIDGLMNHQVHPYILQNRLKDYLDKTDIVYIADLMMMYRGSHPPRGGYDERLLDETETVVDWPHQEGQTFAEMQIRRLRSATQPTGPVYDVVKDQARAGDTDLGDGFVLRPRASK